MNTFWGELPVRDAHVHFFSHQFFASLAQQKGVSRPQDIAAALDWEAPDPQPEAFARRWAAELDRYGVQKAALIASVPGDEESVAAAVNSFPERFFGFFMCNPLEPTAPARLEQALASGLQGICLFPAMHRFSIHDERVTTILEIANGRQKTLVFVHCGVLSVGVRQRLDLPSHFDLRYSNPIDLHAAALRFSAIPFVVPHFGAGYLREALMLCDLCPNVYLDTSSSNRWIRSQPGPIDLTHVFRKALDVAGPKRLLFGTDSSFFPRGWHSQILDDQTGILRQLGTSAEDAALILGGNLERLLGKRT